MCPWQSCPLSAVNLRCLTWHKTVWTNVERFDLSQEGDIDIEEGRDLLQEPSSVPTNATPAEKGEEKEQTPPSKGSRLPTLKLANPFLKKKVSYDRGSVLTTTTRSLCSVSFSQSLCLVHRRSFISFIGFAEVLGSIYVRRLLPVRADSVFVVIVLRYI
jgi:hypothetical protein